VCVSPLAVPYAPVTVSGVPPFISNAALEQELRRFGKFTSHYNWVVKTPTWPMFSLYGDKALCS